MLACTFADYRFYPTAVSSWDFTLHARLFGNTLPLLVRKLTLLLLCVYHNTATISPDYVSLDLISLKESVGVGV